uniref:transglycosylase domain-containing protein n=1 Tax=Lachnospira sp. TaxID=2049031 RepID=UPI0040292302
LGAIQGIIADAPDVSTIDVSPTGYASKIYNSDGEEIQMLSTSGSNRISVDIEDVPLQLQHAFVAIEDERFYEHNGIDIKGIARAAYITLSNGDLSQGASTLTQQLLKNNVFNAYNETTIEKIKRKVQEQYLAVKLETYMNKQEILEDYLNTINLGNGYYGIQAASNGYFGKDVSELTLSECAVIASITQNPTKLNPVKNPDYNQERQQKVLRNMLSQGYIDEDEYEEALADDVYARVESLDIATSSTSTYSYYVDTLIDELIEDLKTQKGYTESQATNLIYKGGLQIYSTQDSNMQSIADSVVNNPSYYPSSTEFSISYALSVKDSSGKVSYYTHYGMLNWYKNEYGDPDFSLTQTNEDTAKAYVERYKDHIVGEDDIVLSESHTFSIQPQISFSLMDQHTGYVKVLVGGRGDKTGNRTLNRATGTTRQPGSAIKPLAAYGPALDMGAITLATAIDDAPYYYSSSSQLVTNFTKGEYRGLMSVREALMLSQNVPAVKVLTQITPQAGFNYLEKFGLSTLVSAKNAVNGSHDVVQSLALGGMTYGVKNIDMTAAYAAIANKGTYIRPIYYTKVYDNNGNLLIDNSTAETREVLKPTTAWLLTSALQSVVNEGTALAARLDNQPVAGKTGTTQNETDKWFCAFTPYYTSSIWIG